MAKSDYNPEIHHRRSIRLSSHNYATSGAYFVTLCVKNRTPLFDRPELHTIVEEAWYALPQQFQGLELDEFVIMPDHVHFIVWLDSTIARATTLGDVIKFYKSLVFTRWLKYIEIHDLNEQAKFWQRNYMEHIIRNDAQLTQRRKYIRNNPLKAKMREGDAPTSS